MTIVILFSFINIFNDPFKLNLGYSFLWLEACYFIGAYVKKYNFLSKLKTRYLLLGILISLIFTVGFKLLVLKFPGTIFGYFGSDLFVKYNSFTILIISVCLLVLFMRMNISNKYLKRFIKRISPATFGVYIIHVHPKIWNVVMKDRFLFLLEYKSIIIILLVLFFAFVVYMLCSYLEMIRIYIFKKLKINNYLDGLYEKIEKKCVF